MLIKDKLNTPGVYTEIISGLVGDLEVILEVPEQVNVNGLALLGHPHSLKGGTMQNKVVTTMARTFRDLGIASIRFNFRGVGRSAGEYDAGVGESEDMLHILHGLDCPERTVLFAGFSFGSYVAFRALQHHQLNSTQPTALITIAPAVQHYDYSPSLQAHTPWLIVMGAADEVVPEELVTTFAHTHQNAPILEYFPDTGHFFHGKLLDLKAVLHRHICEWLQ